MSAPGRPLVASGSQTVGPFFHVGPASTERFGVLVSPDVGGDRIRLRVAVLDGDGMPVPDALIEIWQTDAAGTYSAALPHPGAPAPAFSGFGRLGTHEDGSCVFETIRPGRVCDDGGTCQAAHVNVLVFARGLLRHLYTRAYFDGDPALTDDPLLSIVPADRRQTLLARLSPDGTWAFVIHLQGEQETVFFDV